MSILWTVVLMHMSCVTYFLCLICTIFFFLSIYTKVMSLNFNYICRAINLCCFPALIGPFSVNVVLYGADNLLTFLILSYPPPSIPCLTNLLKVIFCCFKSLHNLYYFTVLIIFPVCLFRSFLEQTGLVSVERQMQEIGLAPKDCKTNPKTE